ncbi:MAG: DUF1127 domain-containing protein [Pseudomonadota bacterium]
MNLLETYNNWKLVRQTRNELNSLSNRELSDLGIHRSEIASIARSCVNGRK